MHTAFIATVESQARPRESSEQGAPFLRNRRPYQLLRRQRDCYGKASSGAASGATAMAWCCAAPPLKSKLVAFSFSKPVLCSCALHSVPVAILYSFLHVARCEPRAVAFAV